MLIARALNDPDHHGSPFEIAKLFLYLLSDFNYCLISIAKSFYCSFICFCLPNIRSLGYDMRRRSKSFIYPNFFSTIFICLPFLVDYFSPFSWGLKPTRSKSSCSPRENFKIHLTISTLSQVALHNKTFIK